jgi:hypothetical protein
VDERDAMAGEALQIGFATATDQVVHYNDAMILFREASAKF